MLLDHTFRPPPKKKKTPNNTGGDRRIGGFDGDRRIGGFDRAQGAQRLNLLAQGEASTSSGIMRRMSCGGGGSAKHRVRRPKVKPDGGEHGSNKGDCFVWSSDLSVRPRKEERNQFSHWARGVSL